MIDQIVNLVNGTTRMRTTILAFVSVAALLFSGYAGAQDAAHFSALAKQCAPSVAPSTLAAVVRHESDFNALAINVNGSDKLPRQPSSVAEAVATAEYLANKGYSFDAGLGQINSANVRKFDLAWYDVFQACPNLQAAATILTQCYARADAGQHDPQAALRDALSCYNTGTFDRGHANGYVHNVELAAAMPAGVQVPALLPSAAGPSTRVSRATSRRPPPESIDSAPGKPDAFANSRGDAFDRAAVMAHPADAIQAMKQVISAASPIVPPFQSSIDK